MTYKFLRAQIKRKSPPTVCLLKNCTVIIDGNSFFKNTYKQSGCATIFGGEYDRYADYLKMVLNQFKKSNVNCYVIFNGAMNADIDRRVEIHQKIINRVDSISPEDEDPFCEPVLGKDVWKEVLNELNIKYFITREDSTRQLLGAAQYFNCPLITNNYHYAIMYTSCISPKSITFDPDSNSLNCEIFFREPVGRAFGIKHCLLPLFFTLVNEQSTFFKKLTDIVVCRSKNLMTAVLVWTRLQKDCLQGTVDTIIGTLSEDEGKEFLSMYKELEELLKRTRLRRWEITDIIDGHGVAVVPYLNLESYAMLSGSWVIFDKSAEDAMLVVRDLICFVYSLVDYLYEVKITFIGRKGNQSCAWEIEKDLSGKKGLDPKKTWFDGFLDLFLPGLDLQHLESIDKDCWLLIITLIYFCCRRKEIGLKLAYGFILSYVMLGPVSNRVGVINRRNFMSPSVVENDEVDANGLKHNDCIAAVSNLIDLFYVRKSKKTFDRELLHYIAEFQHCLQHMNYFNLSFGDHKPTIYYKSVNSTFVYNLYLKIRDKDDVMKYLEKRLKNSTVFGLFKKIATVFKNCFSLVQGCLEEQSDAK